MSSCSWKKITPYKCHVWGIETREFEPTQMRKNYRDMFSSVCSTHWCEATLCGSGLSSYGWNLHPWIPCKWFWVTLWKENPVFVLTPTYQTDSLTWTHILISRYLFQLLALSVSSSLYPCVQKGSPGSCCDSLSPLCPPFHPSKRKCFHLHLTPSPPHPNAFEPVSLLKLSC